MNHRYKVGQQLWLRGSVWIGEIVALFAPGCYFVRDVYGRGCYTEESWLEKSCVEVNNSLPPW